MLNRLQNTRDELLIPTSGRADFRTARRRVCAKIRTEVGKAADRAFALGAGHPLPVRWTAFAMIGAVLLLALTATASWLAAQGAGRVVAAQARAAATLHVALLTNELEKYRAVPMVLAHDPDVQNALRAGDPEQYRNLSRKFEMLSKETHPGIIYLLDAKGIGQASSIWRSPLHSFIGCKCYARPYFLQAMRSGYGEFFAVGKAQGIPGLYIAHAAHSGEDRLGAVIVKVGFRALEDAWQSSGDRVFVTDEHGVVLISNVPQWRFTTLAPLSAQVRNALSAAEQFGAQKLPHLPLKGVASPGSQVQVDGVLPGERDSQSLLISRVRVGRTGWMLNVVKPLSSKRYAAAGQAGSVTFLIGLLLLTLAAIYLKGQERREVARLQQIAARIELEERVAARTSELRAVNSRLVTEMDERRRMEGDLHVLHDELVQANKLATLGQIAAGVAHEINQPVAAIKTYAENAVLFLARDQQEAAGRNLEIIGDLTGRISVITDELRAFSRRATGAAAPVLVSQAIDGALLLVSHRLNLERVRLERYGERAGMAVLGERVRLEQVLVNLLQNALDALTGRTDAWIEVRVEEQVETVSITVVDNGPGLTREAVEALFMPFVTTKTHGLGLGLVISRDIVADLGGDLSAECRPGGASFVISLRKAA